MEEVESYLDMLSKKRMQFLRTLSAQIFTSSEKLDQEHVKYLFLLLKRIRVDEDRNLDSMLVLRLEELLLDQISDLDISQEFNASDKPLITKNDKAKRLNNCMQWIYSLVHMPDFPITKDC